MISKSAWPSSTTPHATVQHLAGANARLQEAHLQEGYSSRRKGYRKRRRCSCLPYLSESSDALGIERLGKGRPRSIRFLVILFAGNDVHGTVYAPWPRCSCIACARLQDYCQFTARVPERVHVQRNREQTEAEGMKLTALHRRVCTT